jgi:hypothetical protein
VLVLKLPIEKRWEHWDLSTKEGLDPDVFQALNYEKDILFTAQSLRIGEVLLEGA